MSKFDVKNSEGTRVAEAELAVRFTASSRTSTLCITSLPASRPAGVRHQSAKTVFGSPAA